MVTYNFKSIRVVPTAKDFIDIILSMTQRKTPTVVHANYKIPRIRSFYIRKIKFTAQNFHDRMTYILEDFPRLEELHPFYRDLINVLYSKDHYKLALAQIHTARTLIDNLARDYVALTKHADSLYRCKELKRICLGRMATIVKKLASSVAYLEQVRQHLSRLPNIDPNTRTLLITGYPNVGKSFFLNKLTNANVEVQPYAFTTKSLSVGHTYYKDLPWQVIDTPGILDHPLEERNTIEMQAVTAMAHIHATVLFFIDISETCGYSIPQQVALYHSIKPLFQNKPLLVVANKIDLKKWDQLDPENRALIESVGKDRNTQILHMSNKTEEGIMQVKDKACMMLLQQRVERKLKAGSVKEVAGRIQIQRPVARDEKERPAFIPETVKAAKAEIAQIKQQAQKQMKPDIKGTLHEAKAWEAAALAIANYKTNKKTEKDLEAENGGPGVYNIDLKKNYDLADPDWRYDIIPEILDGHNVADFVDPDIEQKLQALEKEEEEQEKQYQEEKAQWDKEAAEDALDEDAQELADEIVEAKLMTKKVSILDKTNNKPQVPRKYRVRNEKTVQEAELEMKALGLEPTKFAEKVKKISAKRARSRSRAGGDDGDDVQLAPVENASMQDVKADGKTKAKGGEKTESQAKLQEKMKALRRGRSRTPKALRGEVELKTKDGDAEMGADAPARSKSKGKDGERSASKSRLRSKTPLRTGEEWSYKNVRQKLHAEKLAQVAQRPLNMRGRIGEADRHQTASKPKHLFTGKRGIGKTDRR